MTKDLETIIRQSVESEPRDLVLSLEEGRFLVLVLPLAAEEQGFDQPWKKRFLEGLKNGWPIETAAQQAGISRRHVYRHWESDELFRNAWELIRKKRTRKTRKLERKEE